MNFFISKEICDIDLLQADLITGVKSPLSVATATLMSTKLNCIMESVFQVTFISGTAFKAQATDLIMISL